MRISIAYGCSENEDNKGFLGKLEALKDDPRYEYEVFFESDADIDEKIIREVDKICTDNISDVYQGNLKGLDYVKISFLDGGSNAGKPIKTIMLSNKTELIRKSSLVNDHQEYEKGMIDARCIIDGLIRRNVGRFICKVVMRYESIEWSFTKAKPDGRNIIVENFMVRELSGSLDISILEASDDSKVSLFLPYWDERYCKDFHNEACADGTTAFAFLVKGRLSERADAKNDIDSIDFCFLYDLDFDGVIKTIYKDKKAIRLWDGTIKRRLGESNWTSEYIYEYDNYLKDKMTGVYYSSDKCLIGYEQRYYKAQSIAMMNLLPLYSTIEGGKYPSPVLGVDNEKKDNENNLKLYYEPEEYKKICYSLKMPSEDIFSDIAVTELSENAETIKSLAVILQYPKIEEIISGTKQKGVFVLADARSLIDGKNFYVECLQDDRDEKSLKYIFEKDKDSNDYLNLSFISVRNKALFPYSIIFEVLTNKENGNEKVLKFSRIEKDGIEFKLTPIVGEDIRITLDKDSPISKIHDLDYDDVREIIDRNEKELNVFNDGSTMRKDIGIVFKKINDNAPKNNRLFIPRSFMDELAYVLSDWSEIIKGTIYHDCEDVGEYIKKYKICEFPSIPQMAIMGEAGTGKTTMARNIAEKILGANFKLITSSDLNPAFVGWAKLMFGKTLLEVQADETRPSVLFIDEAYSLFENANTYGNSAEGLKEIIEILLKLSSGDEKDWEIDLSSFRREAKQFFSESECKKLDSNGYKAKKNKNTVIWIGGYEDRLMQSFQANEGLARRFETRIVFPKPKLKELYDVFEANTENINFDSKDERLIKEFFLWGSSSSRSSIFGNYAGAKMLADSIKKNFKIGFNPSNALRKGIDRKKKEIKALYRAELMSELKKMPFEVQDNIDVCLEDYKGYDDLKRDIENVIDMMINPDLWVDRNIRIPKGALMVGHPGSGKTYLAKCMAGELQLRLKGTEKDIAFIPTSAAEILAQKDPVKSIQLLFSEAAKYDASIIFIDEIDTIGRNRHLADSNIAVLTQLMKEMDGFDGRDNLFVLAASNDPDSLDDALKREGRFDLKFVIDIPSIDNTYEMVGRYLEKIGIEFSSLSQTDKNSFIKMFSGMVPATIEAILNNAAILYYQTEMGLARGELKGNEALFAHRRKPKNAGYYWSGKSEEAISGLRIDPKTFLLDVKETIEIKFGGRRLKEDAAEEKFSLLRNEGRSSIAIHETGHALVAMLKNRDIVKITVLGRGMASGYIQESASASTKEQMRDKICIAMGGRAAESVIYGKDNISFGAESDIKKATALARRMVMTFGFSDEIGFMSLERNSSKYLNGSFDVDSSDGMREKAEMEIQRIIKECMDETMELMKKNVDVLKKLAKKVFTAQDMTGAEFKKEYAKVCKKEEDTDATECY